MVILDSQTEPSKIEDKEQKNNDDNNHKPKGPSAGVSSDTEKLVESLKDFGNSVKKNVSEIIVKEKARIQYSFNHFVKHTKHSFELSQ